MFAEPLFLPSVAPGRRSARRCKHGGPGADGLLVPRPAGGASRRRPAAHPRPGPGALQELLPEEEPGGAGGAGGEPVLQPLPGADPEGTEVSVLLSLFTNTSTY